MSMRKIAFWVGMFSLVVGLITYDRSVVTAPVPIVTGLVVVILAALGLIPEFRQCENCGKKISKKADRCIHCGAERKGEKNE